MNDTIIPKVGIYTKALIIYNRRLLMLKRSDYAKRQVGEWDIPGGGLNFNESIIDCLHREILEETSLTVQANRLLYAAMPIMPTKKNDGAVGLVFVCHSDTADVILSREHTEARWVTKSELINMLSEPVLNDYMNNGVFEVLEID